MLRELSINLLLTIGSVRSLKIEDIHSRSLGLGLSFNVLNKSGMKAKKASGF